MTVSDSDLLLWTEDGCLPLTSELGASIHESPWYLCSACETLPRQNRASVGLGSGRYRVPALGFTLR